MRCVRWCPRCCRWRRRPGWGWSPAPCCGDAAGPGRRALVTNLLVLPVAVGLLQGGRWYVGLPLLVWAVAVLGLLFAPGTAADLDED